MKCRPCNKQMAPTSVAGELRCTECGRAAFLFDPAVDQGPSTVSKPAIEPYGGSKKKKLDPFDQARADLDAMEALLT